MNHRHGLANRFVDMFRRLLSGEKLDSYEIEMSMMFEVIAANLLAEVPTRKSVYFDGVDPLISRIRKSRQVEFIGDMWVGADRGQWQESFRATVTDKRINGQGIWIIIWIGADRAEGELADAFGLA